MEKETTQHPLSWTSLEDFVKLYEAGLNPETADMYYPKVDDNMYSNIPYPLQGKAFKPHASDMLCWSLGKLESMLPDTIGEYEIEGCKPYLRPMSDMTTEEDHEFALLQNDFYSDGQLYPIAAESLLEWLKRGNFDYRGLITKGLALKAPKWMYRTINLTETDNQYNHNNG